MSKTGCRGAATGLFLAVLGAGAAEGACLVSGRVTTDGTEGAVTGVVVRFSNGAGEARTGYDGRYSLSVPTGWSGTITPLRNGLRFTPRARAAFEVPTDRPGQDFLAEQQNQGELLGVAVDATNRAWRTSEDHPWAWQTATTHDGVDAARSGAACDGASSWMETTVAGPGQVAFWWKTSSETNGDAVAFLVDGTPQGPSLSGESAWQQRVLAIAGGAHALRWQYARDDSLRQGADAAWLDQVVWGAGGFHRVFWQGPDYTVAAWETCEGALVDSLNLGNRSPWYLRAAGDVDGDGIADLLWQTPNLQTGGWLNAIWFMNADCTVRSGRYLFDVLAVWIMKACADVDLDGHADILWQTPDGTTAVWLMTAEGAFREAVVLGNLAPRVLAGAGQVLPDAPGCEILLQHPASSGGTLEVHSVDAATASLTLRRTYTGLGSWQARAAADQDGDGVADILLQTPSGVAACWLLARDGALRSSVVWGNMGTWAIRAAAAH